jgi:uncharacterized membrane protein YfcA
MFVALFVGYIIGLVLGLLGGGGSILTVPALVYLVGQTPQVAVTASLMIVGTNSALGALFHRSQGTLNWRVALAFGGTGMLTSYLAAGISKIFSPTLLLVLFALLMLFVALLMILRPTVARKLDEEASRNWMVVIAAGGVVGILTGVLGVGGGFLIVPALVMLVGLPMQQAVGTSLIIIAMNSLAGVLGHMGDVTLDMRLIAIFVVTGLLGTWSGTKLAQRLENKLLQRLFAVFVLVLAIFLLGDNLGKLLVFGG